MATFGVGNPRKKTTSEGLAQSVAALLQGILAGRQIRDARVQQRLENVVRQAQLSLSAERVDLERDRIRQTEEGLEIRRLAEERLAKGQAVSEAQAERRLAATERGLAATERGLDLEEMRERRLAEQGPTPTDRIRKDDEWIELLFGGDFLQGAGSGPKAALVRRLSAVAQQHESPEKAVEDFEAEIRSVFEEFGVPNSARIWAAAGTWLDQNQERFFEGVDDTASGFSFFDAFGAALRAVNPFRKNQPQLSPEDESLLR